MYTPRKLAWDNALTTGELELDAQHRYLIDIFNDLGKAIEEGHSETEMERILGIMRFYVGWHFGREEDCMVKFNCPAAGKNKNAHEVFIEKFNKFHAEYERSRGSPELALRIHEELSNWIVNHILAVDGQLYPCIHHKPKP